jgi:hypothetical protein
LQRFSKRGTLQRMTKLHFTKYQPSEVAEITGLSPARQREFRHRDLMPRYKPGNGWTRANAFDLAAILTMQMAADIGIDWATAKVVAEIAADHVVYFSAQHLGGEAKEFGCAKIGGAHRFVVFSKRGVPQLTSDIGEYFDDALVPATLVIDLLAVASELIERTASNPIISEIKSATRIGDR